MAGIAKKMIPYSWTSKTLKKHVDGLN